MCDDAEVKNSAKKAKCGQEIRSSLPHSLASCGTAITQQPTFHSWVNGSPLRNNFYPGKRDRGSVTLTLT